MREELSTDWSRKVTVDRKIIPFEHITNHACGDYPVLRGIHAGSPFTFFAGVKLRLASYKLCVSG
jgi:hypothetical protein